MAIARIWVITGLMAAGKSTVAQALAERLTPSVHLRGDVFRKMIVNGRAEMSPTPSDHALAQLSLRYRLACAAATTYAEAGFTVVYQDVILGPSLAHVARALEPYDPGVVVLTPAYSVVAERDRKRGKTAYGSSWTPERLGAALEETPRLGLWLDTTNDSVAVTVDRILASASAALKVR
jgi:chloramphenicol 3-O-phosphotransferase